MSCPTDEALAAWRAGALPAAERDDVDGHAAECTACRAVAVALAGVVPGGERAGIGAEGALIGRYRITGSLGQGAMGVVLRGHDPVLDREVAIKMSRSLDATDEQRERMLREAQTLARLDHPNVVRVFDAGALGDELFVAMELVDGTTLTRWLATPRSEGDRIAVVAGAGAGIAAVHAAGLVHRDIKPDNILVRDDGGAVLVDFGLARAARTASGPAGSGIAGTPRYLAPELRSGAAATPASDQYAWWTVVEDALADVPRVRDAIARGRADDPGRRYASMEDAIAALVPRRGKLRWLGGPALIGVTAVAIAAWPRASVDPCATSPAAAWPSQRARIVPHLAAAGADPRVLAALDARAERTTGLHRQACRAAATDPHALREQLCIDQSWQQSTRVFAGLEDAEPRTVRDAIDEWITTLPLERCTAGTIPGVPEPPSAASLPAAMRLEAAMREVKLGTDHDAKRRLTRLRALEPDVRALHHRPLEAVWHSALGAALAAAGELVAARVELEMSIQIGEEVGDDDVRTHGVINLLTLAWQQGDGDPAALVRTAEAAAARLGNPAISSQLHMREGTLEYARGNIARALELVRTAQRELETITLDAHGQTVAIAQNLGGIEQASGDLRGAQATFDAGYAVAQRRFGEDHAQTLQIRGARATNYLYRGDVVHARPELEQVAAGLVRVFGPESPPTVQVQSYLCECDLADTAAPTASCEVALATAEHVFGANHPQISWQLVLAGRARLRAGKPADALPLLARAVAISAKAQIAPGDLPIAQAYLAIAQHRTGQEGRALARQAASALRALPEQHETLAALAAEFPDARSDDAGAPMLGRGPVR